MFLLLLIAIAILFFLFKSYNVLQRSSQEVKASMSNISVSMQRKVNLINQLVDVTKNYQDSETLIHLKIAQDANQTQILSTQQDANRTLLGVQGLMSRFPDLKANEQYINLMHSIDTVEKEVSIQREKYNHAAKEFNTIRSVIPTVFVANILKFPSAPYLDYSQENMEHTILKDFNTDSSERLNELFGSAKAQISNNTKKIIDKGLELKNSKTSDKK
jgi:hypothetical protein